MNGTRTRCTGFSSGHSAQWFQILTLLHPGIVKLGLCIRQWQRRMNAKRIVPVKYRRNPVKLDPLTTHAWSSHFLRSTRENAFYFVVFLAFLLFFFHEYCLPCHLISTLGWTFIPQIDNHSDHYSPLYHMRSLSTCVVDQNVPREVPLLSWGNLCPFV